MFFRLVMNYEVKIKYLNPFNVFDVFDKRLFQNKFD